ncbi:short-chain dehydrogenase [Azorhizobium oxalatiphilum]|uniref:Short-chain dehydrogenase n=1 Tax=Azorhizobium oxalatiphilum TaxID=980631 RepID=A0A917FAN5_9HYPH|nr:NAD(P)-dependent oxidoreductase [Azorhizobium oxalatiphilum]GGF62810.1 short-chain dehydrogenase [Azorhizobium oxalatiphilum]
MRVVVVGGTGFVGLNIATAFHAAGHEVCLFDRSAPPAGFDLPVTFIAGDVRDLDAVGRAFVPGTDLVILGAAITAGPAREASDPGTILAVNLGALPGLMRAACASGARRIINLSSTAAYGGATADLLDEAVACDPKGLYSITKFASERIAARLGELWGLEVASVRLSAVFGPWERATGVRDTLSPQAQIVAAALTGTPALLPRPGLRDWIYAPDVAEAVLALATAPRWNEPVYNVSTGARWSALDWGLALSTHLTGLTCRLAGANETATIDLHAPADRPSLAVARLAADAGWTARFGCADSAAHLAQWIRNNRETAA